MDAAFGLLSMIGMFFSFFYLIYYVIRYKKIKKPLQIFGSFFLVFFIALAWPSEPKKETSNKVEEVSKKPTVKKISKKTKEIIESCVIDEYKLDGIVEDDGYIINLTLQDDRVWYRYDTPGVCSFSVVDILDGLKKYHPDMFEKIKTFNFEFMVKDKVKYKSSVNMSQYSDSYSFVSEIKDMDNNSYSIAYNDREVAMTDFQNRMTAERQEKERIAAEQRKNREDVALQKFIEIKNAYDNNEMAAEEQYEGNRYTITGYVDGISDDGVLNKVLREITITLNVYDANSNTQYYIYCSFDAKTWKDKILKLNQGDSLLIDGKCDSWGVWSDCILLD